MNHTNANDEFPLPGHEQKQTKKKKSYGNRTNQRFRRRCRARGMNSNQIERLLKKRQATTNNQRLTTTNNNHNLNKRKRDISVLNFQSQPITTMSKFISSISIHRQAVVKKMKKQNIPIIRSTINDDFEFLWKIYRQPMYLKRSIFMLFRLLNQTYHCSIKKKAEQLFIRARLNLFDQKYFLQVHLQLWQSYLTIGLEHHYWPEELLKMAQTNDFTLCHQFLLNYLQDIQEKIDHCMKKLTEQIESYPIKQISFEIIDRNLKEFVNHQRNYLLRRNNNLLNKFKVNIQNSKTFQDITTYYSTVDQNKFIQELLSIREGQVKIWEQQLILEIRVLCNFLPIEYDNLETLITAFDLCLPLNNQLKRIQINNRRFKIIQEAKRQSLRLYLSLYEMKLQIYEQQYQQILSDLKSLLIKNTSVQGELIYNQINGYMANRTKELKENITKKISVYRDKLIRNQRRSSSSQIMIGVSPSPYLDLIFNPFDRREWHYLSLGPSYIRVNQSAIRPRKQQEIEIMNEHNNIYSKVKNQLVEYPPYIPPSNRIFQNYSEQLLHYFQQAYSTPLSFKDQFEANEQADIFASIRRKIRQHHLTIRLTDKSNNFYIGLTSEFNKKAQAYFTETNAYVEMTNNPFNEILNKVIQLLNQLRSKKLILQWQYNQMIPDPNQTELAHLYFNPKTHKDGIPVRPIVSGIHSATAKISKFLDSIIRPIFDKKCQQITIIDGTSLIQALQKYQQLNRLKPGTLFCTFDIHNLYTMLPQEESLNILIEFLHVHGYRKIKGVPLDAIRKLASIVLKENVFVYEKKIYRQVIGGAMGSAFTLTLANIFMWKWQRELVRIQDITGEYFVRYIDDIFMTWNRSEQQLRTLLNQVNQWHPNIKFDYTISQNLSFLDVLLTNRDGVLLTSVYHKPTAEPNIVPFLSDHHPHVFRNIIQTVLTRAVRYSSTFELFKHERQSIKLMFLYNGYPSTFIDKQFEHFFSKYIGSSSFLPYIYNADQLVPIHQDLNNQPTPQQSQAILSAAKAELDNDQTDNDNPTICIQTNDVVQKSASDSNKIIIHYTHEKRFRSFKRDLHQVHDNVIPRHLALEMQLIVGNRNRQNAKDELIRKKPKSWLLQNKAKQIKKKYSRLLGQRQTQRSANLPLSTQSN